MSETELTVGWRQDPAFDWVNNPEVDYLLDMVAAVHSHDCSPYCLFAESTLCHCRCDGYWHGALLRKTVVGTYDDPRAHAEQVHTLEMEEHD